MKTSPSWMGLALVIAALCGCQRGEPEVMPPDPVAPEPVPVVRTAATYNTAGASRKVTDVRSVTVSVEVENVAGPKTISAEFIAPNGVPYERQSVPLFGSATDAQRFDFRLPVAGTAIDSSGLAGEWTVKVGLQNKPLAEHRFGLEP